MCGLMPWKIKQQKPVSYTHLPYVLTKLVHTRTVAGKHLLMLQSVPWQKKKKTWYLSCGDHTLKRKAVSYTHLDQSGWSGCSRKRSVRSGSRTQRGYFHHRDVYKRQVRKDAWGWRLRIFRLQKLFLLSTKVFSLLPVVAPRSSSVLICLNLPQKSLWGRRCV